VFDDLATDKLVGPDLHPVAVPEGLPLTRVVEAFLSGIRGEGRESFGVGLAVEIVRILHAAESGGT
jgi:hypothetical protein